MKHTKQWLRREACDLIAGLIQSSMESGAASNYAEQHNLTEAEAQTMIDLLRVEQERLYKRGQPLPSEEDNDLGSFPYMIEYES